MLHGFPGIDDDIGERPACLLRITVDLPEVLINMHLAPERRVCQSQVYGILQDLGDGFRPFELGSTAG